MSTVVVTDRRPVTSSRSARELNLIGGTWVEGRGNTTRDICNPADSSELLAPAARRPRLSRWMRHALLPPAPSLAGVPLQRRIGLTSSSSSESCS